jgi:hypothetical protein
MKEQLIEYQKEEIKQKEEEIKYSSELERKKALVRKLNKKNGTKFDKKLNSLKMEWLGTKEILCSFDERTSKRDIEEISGKKLIKENYSYHDSGYSFSADHEYYSETRKNIRTGQNYSYKFKCSGGSDYNYEYKTNDMHHKNYNQRVCPQTLFSKVN